MTSPSSTLARYARGLRIGMDLDGCNLDWYVSVHEWECRTGLTSAPYDPRRYRPESADVRGLWFEEYDMDWATWMEKVVEPGVRAGVISFFGEPYPGAAKGWRQMRAAGHEIHVCTARGTHRTDPQPEIDNTLRMLAVHGFVYDSITFTADKTNLDVDVFVEDQENYHTVLTASGTEVWIVEQSWNAHVETDHRVASVAEFAARVAAGEVRTDLLDPNWSRPSGT